MTSPLALRCAWVLHALAWFVQVVKGGVTLPNGLPGWQAFWFALHPDSRLEWYWAALSISTALSNAIMPGSLVLMKPTLGTWAPSFAVAGVVSFVLDAYWLLAFGEDWSLLRAGYYMWWGSFLLVGIGAFQLARAQRSKLHAA